MDDKVIRMFRAFLYHIKENKLTKLDEKTLFDCTLHSDENEAHPLCQVDSFLWIDVSDPTPEELEALAKRFKLNAQIMEDIRAKEGRPKLHDYNEYIYIIFHALGIKAEGDSDDEKKRIEVDLEEIDCLLGPDWVLTLHDKPVKSFDNVAERWEKRPEWMRNGPAQLFYELMDSVLDGYFPALDQMDEIIDAFEDRLFASSDDESSSEPLSGDIFALKRALLQIRHIAVPTRDVTNVLLRRDSEEGGKHFAAFQDLYDHSSRIVENVDTYREILSGALDAYLAVQSNRMNAVMKRFTAYSIILLFPTLIAGIYGMNFDDMPKHHGFYGSLGIMGSIVVVLLVYFKQRKWM